MFFVCSVYCFFFVNDPATTEIYTYGHTLSLHDALPIDGAVYHTQPKGERRGGLVLIQEIFGVTDHIRELADDYAADGYDVLSPALFDREHPGFESDYS